MYLGTSIGIAVRGDNLEIVCLRGRWRSVTVSGFLRIENFLARPAAEVAREYQRFRKENHALTTSAMVALPRGAGLLRTLEFPPEVAPNLAQAVGYQVDLLHPFEEGGVYFDYAPLPAPPAPTAANGGGAQDASVARVRVAVALVQKEALDRLYDWCTQAGIDVAGFTFSTAAVYQAFRQFAGRAPAASGSPIILIDRRDGSLEITGMAPDGSLYSKEVPAGAAVRRELELCAGELRISPEAKPRIIVTGEGQQAGETDCGETARLEQGCLAVMPELRAAGFRLRENFVAYATALLPLERRLPGTVPPAGLRWNLLPPARRIYRSHWGHAAAYALSALVLGLAAAGAATGYVQDRLYVSWLNGQTRALAPSVHALERLDAKQKELLQRLEALSGQQQDITHKLDAWRELTRLLPASAWLQSLQFLENNMVVISGQAESASSVLHAVNQSAHFQQPEFTSPISKNPEGHEMFQMRMRMREAPLLPWGPAPGAAAQAGTAVPGAGAKGGN